MLFEKVANSWWMYMLGIIVVLFVLAGSLFFIIRSCKDAKELNMDKSIIKRTIINSAIFTILPSISILVGVLSLSGVLGVPLPWIRLTVIGALHYEVVAAGAAYEVSSVNNLNAQMFVTIAFVMTLGILSGPIYCLFGFKSYDKKILSKARSDEENVIETSNENVVTEVSEEKQTEVNVEVKPKKKFGDVLFNAVFIAMIGSFIVWDSIKPFFMDQEDYAESPYLENHPYIPLIVVLVTFGCMAFFDFLVKKCKQKWLSNFDLGLSMIIGMAVAVAISFIGGN